MQRTLAIASRFRCGRQWRGVGTERQASSPFKRAAQPSIGKLTALISDAVLPYEEEPLRARPTQRGGRLVERAGDAMRARGAGRMHGIPRMRLGSKTRVTGAGSLSVR